MILIKDATQQFNPALTLLLTVWISILYFHALNWRCIAKIYTQLKKHWPSVLAINAIIAIVWICTFYSIALTNPFSFILIFFATLALISNTFFFRQNQNFFQHILAFLLIAITLISYTILHAIHALNPTRDIEGMVLATISGAVAFLYQRITHQFHEVTKLSSTQVLAIRSFGIVIIVPSLIPLEAYTQSLQAPPQSWLLLISLAIFTFIIPIYCNQQGIQDSGVEKHSIIIASCPIFAYFLSLIFSKEELLLSPKLLLIFAISMSIGLVLSLSSSKK